MLHVAFKNVSYFWLTFVARRVCSDHLKRGLWTEEMAAWKATFLRSGSVSKGGKEGKETVGAEVPEPRMAELRDGDGGRELDHGERRKAGEQQA